MCVCVFVYTHTHTHNMYIVLLLCLKRGILHMECYGYSTHTERTTHTQQTVEMHTHAFSLGSSYCLI